MKLHEQIRDELKVAMKAKDEVKLRTVRSMLTAFTNESVATGGTPQDMLEDERALEVIKRLAKQRKESIVQYEAADRDEIKPIVEAKIAEMGDVDKSKMGMIIGAVMKELAGKADGGDVKAVVEETLG